MRKILALSFVFLVLAAHCATPELGKDKLRKLVKLPTIIFEPNWTFDAERGFILGSSERDVSNNIVTLRKELERDPADAGRYQRIADLYNSISQSTNARSASARAVGLYRQRADQNPDDGLLLAGFGRALQGAGKKDEAESVLRKAVHLAPKEAKCWLALGRFLDSEARHALLESPMTDNGKDTSDKISPAQLLLAQKRMDEASDCFDKAVSKLPEDAEVYFRRAMHLSLRNMMLSQIRLASGEQKEEVSLLNEYFSHEALADLQHSCRLNPKDYRLQGNTILYEIYTVCAKKGQVNWRDFSWNSLPDKSQRSIREALTRLENLGESPEPQLAAGSLEVLGILQGPVFREKRKSLASLRRAVVLDPAREHAWELMASTLAQSEHYEELLAMSEDRLRQSDNTRNRILLAKAYEKLKRWDESEEEIQAAVKDSPDDFTLNLALGALLLKRSEGNPEVLSEADNWLARAQELLKKMPYAQRNRQQIVDLTLTRSIYFALADEVETARSWIKSVLEQDKENKLALEILSAMDY